MLTILNVAYPLAPAGPDAVGGAEQILAAIDRALVRAGHRSLVIACEGSQACGELLPIPAAPRDRIDDRARHAAQSATRELVAKHAGVADVIHLHGIDFDAYLPPPGRPVLVTLHLPPDWYRCLAPARPNTWFNCVSRAQQRACPAGVPILATIANGVPLEALGATRHACRGYALMLGRICPEKGQHLALQAAHAAHVTLLLAGEVFAYREHQAYFEDKIRPLLDRRRRYLGPVGFIRKRRLLGAALCLLVPSLAAETSSLVAMEALACGTPVIAFAAGALPEIVAHGHTGLLVESADEMASAIGKIHEVDRRVCRTVAEARFSQRRMTDRYLDLYARLAA